MSNYFPDLYAVLRRKVRISLLLLPLIGISGFHDQPAFAAQISAKAAARLLDQTTFGPTLSLIQQVQQQGVASWLNEQFNIPRSVLANIGPVAPAYCAETAYMCAQSEWWRVALAGKDQLRQRVAFALSEIFVVSTDDIALTGRSIPPYVNMLAGDAFGNWSTIMKDVTLSPAMGLYLNMMDSGKATGSEIANENFARENMQLFNLGVNLLNEDGTLKLSSSGKPIPTYTEAQVQAFARVFTGWTWANANGSSPDEFIGTANYTYPMAAVEAHHDENAKTLLNGTVLPAGQTAEQDLDDALTNIFEHPNLPPFVCRQLIQHLVTGDPSPGYVSRVAAVFINDGNNVRGNMRAVLTAIFTDQEARAGDTNPAADGGHLREPILWMTNVMRGLGGVNVDPNNYYFEMSYNTNLLGEEPFAAPSVFNFFPPNYVIPDTTLNSPEFALENTASVIDRLTMANTLMQNAIPSFNIDLSATSTLGKLASSPSLLVDTLGVIFMHSAMDADVRTEIINEISGLRDAATRVRIATYLVITSSEYKVMH